MKSWGQQSAHRFLVLAAAAGALLLGGYLPAGHAGAAQKVSHGEGVGFAGATVRTYLEQDPQGRPVSLGIEIPESILAKLPDKKATLHLGLPQAAKGLQYTFARFDWLPQGHEPPGVYDVPHFDFHFYMMPMEQVQKIAGGADPVVVSSEFVPGDYISPGNQAVPAMGVHWVDKLGPEFNGRPFEKAFIYGAHAGEVIFLEPMATLAYLKSKPDFSADVKQAQAVRKAGYYPRRYSIRYLPQQKVYRISLDDLVRREAMK